jgi:CRP-like cAMP-binding protein
MGSLKQTIQKQFLIKDETLLNEFVELWETTKQFKRNELIINYGKTEKYIYFIEEGTCCITYPDKEEDIVVGFGYPNTFLFSPSIINDSPTEQDVKTIKKTVLKAIHRDVFFGFIKANNSLKESWYKQLEFLLIAQIDRQIDLLISSPEERLERLINRSPHIFQLVPNKYIASYLRMTPETLSRIKKS